MTSTRSARLRWLTAAVGVLMLASACSSSSPAGDPATSGRQLVGLFRLTPGAARGSHVTGTWFRMLQPGGKPGSGPYMINANSPADGGAATLLRPGTSGGLRTGGYQSQPPTAFDVTGNSRADAIVVPTAFFGVRFSISTNETDLQTKTKTPPPTVYERDGRLTADLSSWAASWNRQDFNQGAPKPVSSTQAEAPGQKQAGRVFDYVARKYLDGAPKPTITGTGATGTYDARSRAFELQWTSAIVGGPFNGFTGQWHLEGVFVPGPADSSGS